MNGKELLERFFPSVIESCNFYNGKSEIILVDNGSTDGTEKFIYKNYPDVKFIRFSSNKGFSTACNTGVKEAKGDIIVLLNNDMLVEKDFLVFLVEHFDDKKVFGVRPGLKWLNDKSDFDFNSFFIGIRWKNGMIEFPMLKIENIEKPFYTPYISGGAGAFDREKWLEIGGFDESFNPVYWEDVDISYRAWKRGWILLYEPRSHVYHLQGSTIKKIFNQNYIQMISEKNRYFFIWKNISNKNFLLYHLFFIPIKILSAIFPKYSYRIKGFLLALKGLRKIRKNKKKEINFIVKNDQEIFNLFSYIMKRAKPWI